MKNANRPFLLFLAIVSLYLVIRGSYILLYCIMYTIVI